jgi:hypothetical protein
MQTKNIIKQIVLFFISLVLLEGIFGISLFWPFLLLMKDRKWAFWLAFGSGLFLSSIYNQKIGLMSLFLVVVMTLLHLFMNNSRGFNKWVMVVSVVVVSVFDLVFGLPLTIWEIAIVALVSAWAGNTFESSETIKLNY